MQELLGKLSTINCVVIDLTKRMDNVEAMSQRMTKSKKNASSTQILIIVLTIIISPIPCLFLLISLICLAQGFEYIIAVIIFGVIVFLCIGGGIWGYKSCTKRSSLEIQALNEIINSETVKINDLIRKNIKLLDMIPRDYWYPLATEYLVKVVKDGRANSINEALNMYDQQLHRWKVENMNATILAQSQAQTAYLKKINITNQISAVADVARMFGN